MSKTVLELNTQEAQSFLAWREHQDTFEKLLALGVFGVRNGNAEIHFDPQGEIAAVNLHFKVFQRKLSLDKVVVASGTIVT